jgi:hypothetical protein
MMPSGVSGRVIQEGKLDAGKLGQGIVDCPQQRQKIWNVSYPIIWGLTLSVAVDQETTGIRERAKRLNSTPPAPSSYTNSRFPLK